MNFYPIFRWFFLVLPSFHKQQYGDCRNEMKQDYRVS